MCSWLSALWRVAGMVTTDRRGGDDAVPTLFEQIDSLEPTLSEADLNQSRAAKHMIWKKDHPEEWRRIVKRNNDKRARQRKEGRMKHDTGADAAGND